MEDFKMSKELLDKINSLDKKIQRSLDYQEVDKLMNKYEVILAAGRYKDVEDMFALKTPGVRVEMMWGIYDGPEGIRKLFSGGVHKEMLGVPGNMKPGVMVVLPNSNPVIEVAGDGKTAKAIWICFGHETLPGSDGKLQAYWAYAKRAADFIKEDGVWKIWHYRVYGGFMTPLGKSWVEGFEHRDVKFPEEYNPDRPPTSNWMYKPDMPVVHEPLPPEPYETFDEKTAY
jgi:hypothetical protein